MTIRDVNEQGYRSRMVMLRDRKYHFSDVKYLVMQMNWPFLVMGKSRKLIK